ncbi:MAG: lysine--tRNA ligase [Dehalococcoidia bacterium]|nr:lysine--tRNA ligase [Dehalococcoidia bacterium]
MSSEQEPRAAQAHFESRLAKLERLREQGIEPYPRRTERTHTSSEARALFEADEAAGQRVAVVGRLMTIRGMGRLTFATLRDGSGEIQVSFARDQLDTDDYQALKDLDLGDFLGVSGTLYRTRTEEVTVQAASYSVLSKALRPPPEKWHGLRNVEQRYRQRYLDLMANDEVREIFVVRSAVVSAIRRFMEDRGFIEAETPVLVPVAAGAMAAPFVTRHNALDRQLFLRIATELNLKKLLVGGFEKVFEIGRIFRNEGIDAAHNPEFTTMESYEAYASYEDVMEMVESLVHHLAVLTHGTSTVTYDGQEIDLVPPWRRLSLIDAIREWSEIDLLSEEMRTADGLRAAMRGRGLTPAEDSSWPQLVDKLIGDLVEPRLIQPTFLLDYPIEMTPLAKATEGDARLVERFEGFIGGMEVANSFTELNDPIEQASRLRTQEQNREQFRDEDFDRLDEDFVTAVEHGMPPAGGLGLGIDRLVMILTGQTTIREVVLFPQLRTVE